MVMVENLETRTVLSVSPVSMAVAADRLTVRADLLQFRLDALKGAITIQGDVNALKTAGAKKDPTLAPLFAQLKTDQQAMRKELQSDRLTQATNVLKDQIGILGTLKQIALDHGNADAIAADRETLRTQRVQLQTDEIAGLTTRINTRQAGLTTISADLDAITTAAAALSNPAPGLVDAVNQFSTDRVTLLGTLTSDLTKISADRTQLVADLTAMQNA